MTRARPELGPHTPAVWWERTRHVHGSHGQILVLVLRQKFLKSFTLIRSLESGWSPTCRTTHTHTHTYAHPISLSCAHIHTNTHTHKHIRTRVRSLPLSRALSLSLSLSSPSSLTQPLVATSAQSRIQSHFQIAFFCTASRRIAASASINPGSRIDDLTRGQAARLLDARVDPLRSRATPNSTTSPLSAPLLSDFLSPFRTFCDIPHPFHRPRWSSKCTSRPSLDNLRPLSLTSPAPFAGG